ncbi:PREDICTED: sugar phosphate exchanger 2-like isoform X1 [Priapulus caudatus]|uniref:Sugar phosphate exchanger 2-like isoform X1 n=1 Tax=Priapulus caudatus TaxID=37621 RepID=A0ABM1DUR8_PRICU|nr:PREDICTED: sugar phosphate exchanger 2-like isoform X1 [Priapulus caudatus]
MALLYANNICSEFPRCGMHKSCAAKMLRQLLGRRFLVFAIAWLAYASGYLLRKPIGVIKVDLEQEFKFTKLQLGWMDSALTLPYATFQVLFGSVGDTLGARRTSSAGLLIAAVSMVSFGYWNHLRMFLMLLVINGIGQSQCWPNFIKIIGLWFTNSNRNTVFGIYGTCAFAGGIAGTSLAVYLQASYGWRHIFFLPSVIVAVSSVLVFLFCSEPSELGLVIPSKDLQTTSNRDVSTVLSWSELLKMPILIDVSLAMFCLKLVRYCMYMWLPLYLLSHLSYGKTEAGMFSTMFEVGGVVGSATIGLVIDRMFKGNGILGSAISALFCTVCLLCFTLTRHWGVAFNSAFMVLVGAFNCGPDTILGGSVSAQLGEMNGRSSAASVTGIVNGFGTLGTVVQGPLIGFVSEHYGWPAVFYIMVAFSMLGSVCIFHASTLKAALAQEQSTSSGDSRRDIQRLLVEQEI